MKVVFIGVDGVLNSFDDFYDTARIDTGCGGFRLKTRRGAKFALDTFFGVTTTKARRLAGIVSQTGAKVVVVSSWGTHYESAKAAAESGDPSACGFVSKTLSDHLVNELAAVGLSIYDTTKRFEGETHPLRARGIDEWLKAHPDVDGWVIIDTPAAYRHWEGESNPYRYQSDHLVATNSWVESVSPRAEGGLTRQCAKRAVDMLRGESR